MMKGDGGRGWSSVGGETICGQYVGPETWFAVMLGAGLVALVYGLVWMLLLFSKDQVPNERPRHPVLNAGWLALMLMLFGWQLSTDQNGDRVGLVVELALLVPPLLVVYAVGRRARAQGWWPSVRTAPWGAAWILPAVAVVGLVLAVGAAVEMARMTQVVPC